MPAQLRAADPATSIADLPLPALACSHAAQQSTGALSLTIGSITRPNTIPATFLLARLVRRQVLLLGSLPVMRRTASCFPLGRPGLAVDPGARSRANFRRICLPADWR